MKNIKLKEKTENSVKCDSRQIFLNAWVWARNTCPRFTTIFMSVKVRPWCEITLRTKRGKTSVTIKFMFPHERHWHPNTANTMCLSSWKKPTRRFLLDYLLVKRKIYNFDEKLDCYLSFACKIHQDLNKFTEQLKKNDTNWLSAPELNLRDEFRKASL